MEGIIQVFDFGCDPPEDTSSVKLPNLARSRPGSNPTRRKVTETLSNQWVAVTSYKAHRISAVEILCTSLHDKIALDKASTFGNLVRYPFGVISRNLRTQLRRASFESSGDFNTVILSKTN